MSNRPIHSVPVEPGSAVASGLPDAAAQAHIVGLIESNYKSLQRVLRCRVHNRDLVADLANEASTIALEHARSGRLTEPQRVAGYVLAIAMNLLRNQRRKADNRWDLRADPDVLLDAMQPSSEEQIETERLKRLVRTAIASLSTARDRTIVVQFYLEDQDKAAICSTLGITAEYFDKIAFRARQRMKGLIESFGFKKYEFFSLLL